MKRDTMLHVRVSKADLAILTERAEAQGMSVSAYARWRLTLIEPGQPLPPRKAESVPASSGGMQNLAVLDEPDTCQCGHNIKRHDPVKGFCRHCRCAGYMARRMRA